MLKTCTLKINTYYSIVPHREIWGQVGSKLIVGAVSTTSNAFDLTIEVSPGVYRLADRGVLTLFGSVGDSKCDDDTMLVIFSRKIYNTSGTSNVDTLTMPIAATSASDGVFSFGFAGGGSGLSDAAYLVFQPEAASSADSCYVFTEIYLEVDQ